MILFINFEKCTVRVKSDETIVISGIKQQAVCLRLKLSQKINSCGKFTLEFYDADHPKIYWRGTRLVVKAPTTHFSQGKSLIYIAQWLAELECTSHYSLLIHAGGVVDPDGQAVLILGDKGAGKTSIVLELCRSHGYYLIGGDQVRLSIGDDGGLWVGPGDQQLVVRKSAVEAEPCFRTLEIDFHQEDNPDWETKERLPLAVNGITPTDRDHKMKSCFKVRIDRTACDSSSGVWPIYARTLFIHELIGRHISGQATPFMSDSGRYYGSIPRPIFSTCGTEDPITVRDRLAAMLIASEPLWVHSSDTENCIDEIKAILQGEIDD